MTAAGHSLRQRVRITFAVAIAIAVVVAGAGVLAFVALLDARETLVERADPALVASARMLSGLVDQEDGIRVSVLTTGEAFLEPYERGTEEADRAREQLERIVTDDQALRRLEAVDREVEAWRTEYAEPTLAGVRANDPAVRTEESLAAGRARFDAIREAITDLDARLVADRREARDRLDSTTTRLIATVAAALLLLVLIAAFVWRLMRREVEMPLARLGDDVRQIAEGDYKHPVEPVGPSEIQALGQVMEQMRQRIVEDLAAVTGVRDTLERQTRDLARSNAELEQFAYVASHDLQEPLRKVASFCQLLQSRYGGQLDERADQYIAFAVDGATRMQALINDLLSFSRVGSIAGDEVDVDAGDVISSALDNLDTAIEESGAKVTVGEMPTIRIEASLGVALFQNLISNAIKFARPGSPPRVEITARRSGNENEFSVSDNGIGIEPEYAERIFVIFQRLHAKNEYGGTGIGLALCRKIVEHHDGRIWVDTSAGRSDDGPTGATVCFTLPVVEEDEGDEGEG